MCIELPVQALLHLCVHAFRFFAHSPNLGSVRRVGSVMIFFLMLSLDFYLMPHWVIFSTRS